MLKNKKILVGVTGSIAAYKSCDLVQRLKEKGATVRVVMTASAARVVHPNTFAALSGAPVLTDAWEGVSQGSIPHIEAARWADLFLIAPCTAHTLAELSLGLTGSPVSMTALAYKGPLAVAPAMNTIMLDSDPMREHMARLARRGVHMLPTLNGSLACGEIGEGKLTTPEEITAYAELIFAYNAQNAHNLSNTHSGNVPDLTGVRVLLSGGHTEEALDGVRHLSNRSSGKTALAIARALRMTGADVRLVLGGAEEAEPNGIALTRVGTSAGFRDAMLAAQPDADVVIMAAAIADFTPAEAERGNDGEGGKWKASRELKSLALSPFPNILEELGQRKAAGTPPHQTLVGFALETDDALKRGAEKMRARHCDLMVVNTPLSKPGLGFGSDGVEAAILNGTESAADGAVPSLLQLQDKSALAVDLVHHIAAHRRMVQSLQPPRTGAA